MRLGEAQNPGPAAYERDQAEECSARSITRGVQNLLLTDTPATQTTLPVPAPPPIPISRRVTQPRTRQTLAVLSVVQIQKSTKEPRTMASCCTWFRSMVASSSFKKVLPNRASSTVHPVFSVTQFDRDGALAAVIAGRTLQPGTSSLVPSFKTADKARPPLTLLLTARSQCRQETHLMTAHSRTARSERSFSQNMTSSSPIFAEVQRWPFLEAWSRVTPQRGQSALREPSVATSPGRSVPVSLPPLAG